jgi:NAD-reducing hydrogenase small subunit
MAKTKSTEKIKLATVWLDGCSGCHMSFLDIDGVLLDIADRVKLVYSPLVDNKVFPDMVDVTLVEGGVSSVDDRAKIIKIRKHTKILVSLGDCAITGNVPAMRNRFEVEDLKERVYVQNSDVNKAPPTTIVPELFCLRFNQCIRLCRLIIICQGAHPLRPLSAMFCSPYSKAKHPIFHHASVRRDCHVTNHYD